MTSDVTLSRGRDVTPSHARSSRERMADLRRLTALDQQVVKIRIAASEVDALREKGYRRRSRRIRPESQRLAHRLR